MSAYKFPTEPETGDRDGDGLFCGAFPAHGNGGHLSRDWNDYKSLTINEVCHLYFGMNPLADQTDFWNGAGTYQLSQFNNIADQVVRAVMSGQIRTINIDIPKSKDDITMETTLITDDVLDYFGGNIAVENTEPPRLTNEEKPLIETERNSLLKMILGMAIDAYGYEPGKENTATGAKAEV